LGGRSKRKPCQGRLAVHHSGRPYQTQASLPVNLTESSHYILKDAAGASRSGGHGGQAMFGRFKQVTVIGGDWGRTQLALFFVNGSRTHEPLHIGYPVDPLFFPGGDIGKLAVCGTINDLAVGGAIPLYLTCSAIIEEGLAVDTLRSLAKSMALAAANAGASIVTGDTKVVHKGTCDKLFLNMAGIGIIREGVTLGADRCRPGDAVLVNGLLGDHGAAILNARGDMALSTEIESDCAALHELVADLLAAAPATRFIRDATRGGLATVLNEAARASGVGIEGEGLNHLDAVESVRRIQRPVATHKM
jgi:AIR synthase related protein, N-terminal domain/AIR synthase related protein, C-terminal domain